MMDVIDISNNDNNNSTKFTEWVSHNYQTKWMKQLTFATVIYEFYFVLAFLWLISRLISCLLHVQSHPLQRTSEQEEKNFNYFSSCDIKSVKAYDQLLITRYRSTYNISIIKCVYVGVCKLNILKNRKNTHINIF